MANQPSDRPDERMAVAAHSLDRDEHVAGLDRARIVAHRANLDVAIADQASVRESVDELAQRHG